MYAQVPIIGTGGFRDHYRPQVDPGVDTWQAHIPTDDAGHPLYTDCMISVPFWKAIPASLAAKAMSPVAVEQLLRKRNPALKGDILQWDPSTFRPEAVVRYQLANDAFTRADSTDLGASWDAGYSGAANLQIVSNKVRNTVITTQEGDETYNATTLPANAWTQVDLATWSANAVVKYAWVVARAVAPATVTWYQATIARNDGTFTSALEKKVSGTGTTLASENATTWATNDVLRIEVVDSGLRLYRNNGLLLSASDSSITTAGRAGMGNYIASSGVGEIEFDNFVCGGFGPLETVLRGVCRGMVGAR